MRLEFGQLIDVDVERTRAYYQTRPGIHCACRNCQNFQRAAETFPQEVKDFFESLGIDLNEPAEMYMDDHVRRPGKLAYYGYYHLCGQLLEDGWKAVKITSDGRKTVDRQKDGYFCHSFSDFFFARFNDDTSHFYYCLGQDCPEPVLLLEVCFILPWLLESEECD